MQQVNLREQNLTHYLIIVNSCLFEAWQCSRTTGILILSIEVSYD